MPPQFRHERLDVEAVDAVAGPQVVGVVVDHAAVGDENLGLRRQLELLADLADEDPQLGLAGGALVDAQRVVADHLPGELDGAAGSLDRVGEGVGGGRLADPVRPDEGDLGAAGPGGHAASVAARRHPWRGGALGSRARAGEARSVPRRTSTARPGHRPDRRRSPRCSGSGGAGSAGGHAGFPGREIRTPMRLPSPDFESGASAVPPSRAPPKCSRALAVVGRARAPRRGPIGRCPRVPSTAMTSTAASDQGDVLTARPPRFTLAEAAAIAADLFGVRGTATPLVSERDQNFRIAADDGRGWVLKISNPGEREGVVEMETGVVRHVAAVDPTLPVAVPRETRDGAPWGTVDGADGARHFVRLLPLMPGRNGTATELSREPDPRLRRPSRRAWAGRPAATSTRRPAGRSCGTSSTCRRCGRTSRSSRTPRRRAIVEAILDRFDAVVGPGAAGLPRAGHPQRPDVRQHAPRRRRAGQRDRRLRGHGPHGARPRPRRRARRPPRRPRRPGRPLRRRGGRPRRLRGGHAARGRGGGPPRRPRRGAARPDDAHLGLADPALPGERGLPVVVGRRGLADAGAVRRDRPRRGPPPASPPPLAGSRPGRCRRSAGGCRAVGRRVARRRAAGRGRARRRAPGAPPPRARLGALERSPTSGRSTSSAARAPGCTTPRAAPTSTATTTCPVVGHSHPRVVAAIARQAATLNTNTRYLHRTVVELAERIVATMPPGLDTVMFVNSGQRGERPGLAARHDRHRRPRRDRHRLRLPRGLGGDRRPLPGGVAARRAAAPRRDRPAARHVPAARGRRARLGGASGGPPRRGRRRARRRAGVAARGRLRRRRLHERRDLRAAAGVPAGAGPADPRRRRALRRRRGPGRLRPDGRRAVELRRDRDRPRHRHPRQADGERPPGGGGGHPVGHRRPVRRRDRVLQHVRRQPVACAAAMAVLDVLEDERLVGERGGDRGGDPGRHPRRSRRATRRSGTSAGAAS